LFFLSVLICFVARSEDAALADGVIPPETKQLIVGVARDWDDSHVVLQRYERRGASWVAVGRAVPGRLGRDGLAWGRGLHPRQTGRQKREGDMRAPAGVFRLGGLYGDMPVERLRLRPGMSYHRVTTDCLWVEDPESEFYNRHIRAKVPGHLTDWEKKQQMKQNDYAHELKLLIHHNTWPDIEPGAGSAIFFHIWRKSGALPASGCTVMSRDDLIELAQWVDPALSPVYVLLPIAEYERLRHKWGLPVFPRRR
jgi:L,D-peptidoglycan transpeptidase YkuD (ErfK/YbiS/YcfS/YnhG family)